ncbi:MAG: hypothetical protein K2Z81_09160, partial [Cyanobacteria bacterium]|nr:hypothetical protein [Cyanobacteriota bacterium]
MENIRRSAAETSGKDEHANLNTLMVYSEEAKFEPADSQSKNDSSGERVEKPTPVVQASSERQK